MAIAANEKPEINDKKPSLRLARAYLNPIYNDKFDFMQGIKQQTL